MTEEKKTAVMCYEESMSLFLSWYNNRVISLEDLRAIDTKLSEKYGINSSSIYRPQPLTYSAKRVINITAKGAETDYDD